MEAMKALFTKKRLIVAILVIVAVAVAVAVAIAPLVLQPGRDDYQSAKSTQVAAAQSARDSLAPAVNAYLASFKNALNESNSLDEATKVAKPEYDAFKKVEAKANAAIAALSHGKAASDSEVGTAIRQFQQDYDAEVTYYAGLVESYPEYTVIFADSEKSCGGVLVGETSSLADRKQQLDEAALECFAVLDTLKKSSNETYTDFAKKIERRVKQMQEYAAVTAKTESDLQDFDTQAADFQAKAAEADARGASEEEMLELADEIQELSAKIDDNNAIFDFAAKRYISTVKDLPETFEAVYGTNVPAKLAAFEELNGMRKNVLTLTLDGKLAE